MSSEFQTAESKEAAEAIVKRIFEDFENVKITFSDYGAIEVTVDDLFSFCFVGKENLLQALRVQKVVEWKRLEKARQK